ncbi:hypothetical protein HMSSN036_28270 [Paenibacillus macerans]|nr:hypothetical protein HMSSN036_28270 [Paenibacillus macerans]
MLELSNAEKESSIEEKIRHLVHIRASQMNGCGFCLDMHVKEAKIHGESELRLYHISIWRESTLFSPRERAALAWTEVLTKLPEHGVPDDIYNRVREQLSEKKFRILPSRSWRSMPGTVLTSPLRTYRVLLTPHLV